MFGRLHICLFGLILFQCRFYSIAISWVFFCLVNRRIKLVLKHTDAVGYHVHALVRNKLPGTPVDFETDECAGVYEEFVEESVAFVFRQCDSFLS